MNNREANESGANFLSDSLGSVTHVEDKCSLFVGDLARFCTENDILNSFREFGNVVGINIKRSKKDGSSLGYGFVKMETPEMAIQAMNRLNGVLLCGRPLRISWGVYKNKPDSIEQNQRNSVNSVYIRFKTIESGKIVNEEILNTIFSTFGKILDASVKSSTFHKITGIQSGYGFVHFTNTDEGIQSAIDCVNSMKYAVINGVVYQVEPSKNQLMLIDEKYHTNDKVAQYVSTHSQVTVNSQNNASYKESEQNVLSKSYSNQNQHGKIQPDFEQSRELSFISVDRNDYNPVIRYSTSQNLDNRNGAFQNYSTSNPIMFIPPNAPPNFLNTEYTYMNNQDSNINLNYTMLDTQGSHRQVRHDIRQQQSRAVYYPKAITSSYVVHNEITRQYPQYNGNTVNSSPNRLLVSHHSQMYQQSMPPSNLTLSTDSRATISNRTISNSTTQMQSLEESIGNMQIKNHQNSTNASTFNSNESLVISNSRSANTGGQLQSQILTEPNHNAQVQSQQNSITLTNSAESIASNSKNRSNSNNIFINNNIDNKR